MAKRIKKALTKEELMQQELKTSWDFIEDEVHLIPEPTYTFQVGEEVEVGNLRDCKIEEAKLNGKVYLVNYTSYKENYGNPIITPNCKMYVKWIDINKKGGNSDFSKRDDMKISFSQMQLSSLFTKVYSFGVDFEPEYQRGYVWGIEDKIALIDSIFDNIEIGKFAFIHLDDKEWSKRNVGYEILDGKQRLSTLCDFYEGKFAYKGLKFNELSSKDRRHILSYPVSIGEVSNATEEQIIKYFIKLNSHGKVMDKQHLEKVKNLL